MLAPRPRAINARQIAKTRDNGKCGGKAHRPDLHKLGVHATLDTQQRVLAVIAFLDAR